jgi:hypothetical protein
MQVRAERNDVIISGLPGSDIGVHIIEQRAIGSGRQVAYRVRKIRGKCFGGNDGVSAVRAIEPRHIVPEPYIRVRRGYLHHPAVVWASRNIDDDSNHSDLQVLPVGSEQ